LIDAQISPHLVPWIAKQFGIEVHAVRDLGLKTAKDQEIFSAARKAKAIVMTKDSDFLILLEQHGPPPQILWITCGNTSNERLEEILQMNFKQALQWLKAGEKLVEISDPSISKTSP
jgi:predicted nuclease of predicted toxin-antitoxin system